ncbi:MAG TPA: sulfate ABC transporter permease subunit CysT [Thermoanaerobaculia bacterium]|nr:sulfate ABC transporter permease subunit CysT [Thermoanaerobaculia bacterium]
MRAARVTPSLLPGFGPALGVTLLGLSLVVLAPLAILLATSLRGSPAAFLAAVTTPRVVAALRLSFLLSFGAAAVSALLGLLLSWVLVRYRFPGRRLLDALIDLPFALPTAVAGITLTTLYAPNGWLGKPLASLGIPVAFTPLGIGVALVFLGLPFTVRTLQPVLASLDSEVEDAAASLGAPRLETFRRVLLPELLPSFLTGATLAFARGLGEYGSVVFISGNMPMKTEIAPLLVMTKLEQYDMAGATALATVLLLASFLLLLLLNRLEAWAAGGRR